MNKTKWVMMAVVPALLVTMTACATGNETNRTVIKEPGKSITVIDNDNKESVKTAVSVEKIDEYKKMQIAGWLNDTTVVVSKENEKLDKMELAELSDSYPRSLYLLHLDTGELEPLVEQENVNLGEASLSPDKKHLLYSEYTLGDPIYTIMEFGSYKKFQLSGKSGTAASARWADDGTVVGASFSGGAFTANPYGSFEHMKELQDEGALFIVVKNKDKVYFSTGNEITLMMLDNATGEKTPMNLQNVTGLVPSPDGERLLIQQSGESKMTLTICDANGDNENVIAEGAEIGGIAWSPDQSKVAYTLKADGSSTTTGLYVHDMLSGKSTQIAVDTENATTSWSPDGDALVYAQWDGSQFDSKILHLSYSLKP